MTSGWAREGSGKESDLEWPLKFLTTEIERRKRESFKSVTSEKAGGREPERKSIATASAAALKTSTAIECGFCQQNHLTEKYRMVLQLPVRERQAGTKDAGLCFRCLKPSHLSRSRSARCRICQG